MPPPQHWRSIHEVCSFLEFLVERDALSPTSFTYIAAHSRHKKGSGAVNKLYSEAAALARDNYKLYTAWAAIQRMKGGKNDPTIAVASRGSRKS